MKTRQYWIDLHKKNVTWANDQIRICLMSRRVLKGIEQSKFSMLLHHANEHSDAELLPLKQAIAKYQDGWNLRFQNYSLGLLSEIFDINSSMRLAPSNGKNKKNRGSPGHPLERQ